MGKETLDELEAKEPHSPEKIMRTVPNDAMLNADKDVAGVVQLLEVNEATHLRWRTQSGGMNAEEAEVRDSAGRDQALQAIGGRPSVRQCDFVTRPHYSSHIRQMEYIVPSAALPVLAMDCVPTFVRSGCQSSTISQRHSPPRPTTSDGRAPKKA
jgi:hypothetical protein